MTTPSIYVMHFTDRDGLCWAVIDCIGPRGARKRLRLGDWTAEYRAFVPVDRDGPVMLFRFGLIAYRDTRDRTLQDTLDHAYPSTASPRERMEPKPLR